MQYTANTISPTKQAHQYSKTTINLSVKQHLSIQFLSPSLSLSLFSSLFAESPRNHQPEPRLLIPTTPASSGARARAARPRRYVNGSPACATRGAAPQQHPAAAAAADVRSPAASKAAAAAAAAEVSEAVSSVGCRVTARSRRQVSRRPSSAASGASTGSSCRSIPSSCSAGSSSASSAAAPSPLSYRPSPRQ